MRRKAQGVVCGDVAAGMRRPAWRLRLLSVFLCFFGARAAVAVAVAIVVDGRCRLPSLLRP